MLDTSASMPSLPNLSSLADFPEAMDILLRSVNDLKQENNVKGMDSIKQMEEVISQMKRQWLSTQSLPITVMTDSSFHQHQHQHQPARSESSGSGGNHHDSLAARYGGKISQLLKMISSHSASTEIEETPEFDKLDNECKRALLCFSLFEEGEEIKKRELIHWWVGQQLIKDGDEAQAAAAQILEKLVDFKVIQQVIRRGKKLSKRYKMSPTISSKIKEEIGNAEKVGLLRMGGSSVVGEKKPEDIEALFNPSETVLSIKRDWLANMKNLKLIRLGRWCNDPELHLEVADIEFLKSLKRLKQVRLLSLRGISRIMKLPDSVGDLSCLRVLDLRACPNLEVLPKEIGKLKNLTHLDLSECYLLDYIPKEVSSLTRLQVLDGFVIGDLDSNSSCSLKDLSSHLGHTLKKLSISVRKTSFPTTEDLRALAKFVVLGKLKIIFVRTSSHLPEPYEKKPSKLLSKSTLLRSLTMVGERTESNPPTGLPPQLLKLELQAMPDKVAATLLVGDDCRFENLKKLYIIGGGISDLGRGKEKWKEVETIHFKYLTKLHMDWRQFKRLFPNVIYLEMVQCPNLSFFPCDRYGIWKQSS